MSTDTLHQPLRLTWSMFARQCAGAAAGDEQTADLRRAYYCGANSMLVILRHITELPEHEKAEVMRGLEAECALFMATMGGPLEGRL